MNDTKQKESEWYQAGYAAGYEGGNELPDQYEWGGREYDTRAGADYRDGFYEGCGDRREDTRKAKPIAHDSLAWLQANKVGMTARLLNCLQREIDYAKPSLMELMAMTDAEWLRTPNFGRKSLEELRKILPGSGAEPIDMEAECARLTAMSERLEAHAKILRKLAKAMQADMARIT